MFVVEIARKKPSGMLFTQRQYITTEGLHKYGGICTRTLSARLSQGMIGMVEGTRKHH